WKSAVILATEHHNGPGRARVCRNVTIGGEGMAKGGGWLAAAKDLSDRALLERVDRLATSEREATAELVAQPGELDARQLYRGEGYPSTFAYCTSALHLSEHSAYNRIEVARLARKLPLVLARLAQGSVNLTTLRVLAPLLTSENCDSVLREAEGK